MTEAQFETLLDLVAGQLTSELQIKRFNDAKVFENRVREVLRDVGNQSGIVVNFNSHKFGFPDIAVGKFGIEVKHTTKDTWRSVANSVNEGFRDPLVEQIYVMFGKEGGAPETRWAKYDDAVIHVRTSHMPRFEVEIGAKRSLFKQMGVTYADFSKLSEHEKMKHIRAYSKSRLKPGERLWWLGDDNEPEHSLPIQARLYTSLSMEEKLRMRAEATLLCPRILEGGRSRTKYNDAALYLLTYRGVLTTQVRDLFSAGSVAHRGSTARGGLYIQRALIELQDEMCAAANYLDDALFIEYWGESVPPMYRIPRWLELADLCADGWKPSRVLFLNTGA